MGTAWKTEIAFCQPECQEPGSGGVLWVCVCVCANCVECFQNSVIYCALYNFMIVWAYGVA